MQPLVHYFLHFGFIAAIAYFYDKENFKTNYLILLATMLIDLDHLFANPFFDPNRCSINFHFLHTYYAWAIYLLGFIITKKGKLQLAFLGLNFHLITDLLDCLWSNSWDISVL